jgi:hypothetical protein
MKGFVLDGVKLLIKQLKVGIVDKWLGKVGSWQYNWQFAINNRQTGIMFNI